MKGKHEKLLKAIFQKPAKANIKWKEVESMLKAFGAEFSEGRGSRIRIKLNDVRIVFHIPHPEPELGKGRVEDISQFLMKAGLHHDYKI